MRILISNSVPLNGGDEALLRAAMESIRVRWPESCVRVLCHDVVAARRQASDIEFEPDLEFACPKSAQESRRVELARRLRGSEPGGLRQEVSRLLEPPCRRRIIDLYAESDVVLSAPGGFLHDFYALEERLRGFELAKAYGCRVILFGQSLGPFWKPTTLQRVPQVLNRVDRICVRDEASENMLIEVGVDPVRIVRAADIAFLWRRLAPELMRQKSGPPHVYGLCFRVWPIGDVDSTARTLQKAHELCVRLLEDPHAELRFISTCQGIDGYVDDSLLAVKIVASLPEELHERCVVDRTRYAPRELIMKLGECDLFIGMRLHACILAMLAGVPAMGLGYEQKTAEIFGQLGFESYQVDFRAELPEWYACLDRILTDLPRLRAGLPSVLDAASSRAYRCVEVLEDVSSSGA